MPVRHRIIFLLRVIEYRPVMTVSRIESRRNAEYKRLRDFVSRPESEECPWVPVEGWKQVLELSSRLCPELLLYTEARDERVLALAANSVRSLSLSSTLLQGISSLQSSQGVIAFFKKPEWKLEDLTPWVLYLWRLQDPGNLGTLLRTAGATGFFSVAGSPDTVSRFNSKVIRASVNALFTVPMVEGVSVEDLRRRGYRLTASTALSGESLFEAELAPGTAFIVGNEGSGIAPEVVARADSRLHIPMQAASESLNAAVAGSLIMYEAYRRRSRHA
jgi:RNA methyltransferase, TrmH family